MKRIFDVVVGTLLAVLALPAVVVLAVGSALSLGCWPFFVHKRVGQNGQSFPFLKVRTLPPSTPRYALKYAVGEITTPRFTRWIRERHLDELPQLFLVPLGRMSLVGPRPEMPALHDAFDANFARTRSMVRPGCTGLWQIGDECHRLIGEAPEYDCFYVDNRTFLLDMWILGRTLRLMATGVRTTLADVPSWALRRRDEVDLFDVALKSVES